MFSEEFWQILFVEMVESMDLLFKEKPYVVVALKVVMYVQNACAGLFGL